MRTRPVVPRPAATVAVLRDGTTGLEVFLQRRVAGMAFAPSVTVFPGGRVDPADQLDTARWAGPALDWWADRLDTPTELAGALVVAAIRETFEESGVLLAGPDADQAAAETGALRHYRDELASGQRTFLDVLRLAGLTLRADLLAPWARWITPESEALRYDTWFFLTALPAGQQADAATSEVADAGWWSAQHALADWRAGRMLLYPPTWVTLQQLAELPDVGSALAAAEHRTIEPIMPTLHHDGDRLVVDIPDGTR